MTPLTPPRVWRVWLGLALLPVLVLLVGVIALTQGPASSVYPAAIRVSGVLEEIGGLGNLHAQVPGTVTFRSTVNGRYTGLTYTVRVSRNGKFDATVVGGAYTVVGNSPYYQDGHLPCSPEGSDVVNVHTSTSITVVCSLR